MVQDILFRRDRQALLKFQLTVKAVFNADGCKTFLPRHAQVDEPALRVCDFVGALDCVVQRIAEQVADVHHVHKVQRCAVSHAGQLNVFGAAGQTFACQHRVQHLIAGVVLCLVGFDLLLHIVQHGIAFLAALGAKHRDLVLQVMIFLVDEVNALLPDFVVFILDVQHVPQGIRLALCQ